MEEELMKYASSVIERFPSAKSAVLKSVKEVISNSRITSMDDYYLKEWDLYKSFLEHFYSELDDETLLSYSRALRRDSQVL